MENRKYKRKISLSLQYAAAISASITTIGFGIINSWTSPALPHLTSPASQFSVSVVQGAWVASVSGCGTIIGYLLNTILIDRLGRKRTLLFLAMPQTLSWILIYLGRDWIILCLARVIGGIGYGCGLCATAVYLAEIGDQNTRGVFLTLIKMSINIGIFITMFFGAFLSYNTMNLILLGIPIIFIISFFYMPDSNQFDIEEVVEEDEDGFKEKTVHVLNEYSVEVLNENIVVDVLKEKTLDILKENADDVLNKNKVDVPKENTIHVLKENTVDILKENTLNALEENTMDMLNENTVDLPKENTIDHLKEHTMNLLKENRLLALKENTIIVLNDTTVDVLQESTINFLTENTVCLLNESNLHVLRENRHNDTSNSKQGSIADTKEGTIEEKTILLNKNHHSTENKLAKNIFWRLFVLKNNQKAFLIILIASLTDIFSGHMAIVSYTQQIFDYSGATLKAEHAALVLAVLKIAASLISTLVVERFERRDLFLSTGILAGFAQGLVGLFFFLKMYLKVNVSYITWLPLFGVSMYEVVGSVGLSSLYYVYQGELFSNDVKGVGYTCTNIAYESVTFFIKFHFQMVIDSVGIYTLFWGFGICCVIGSCLTYWISPETKGKSSEDIQNLLRGSKKIRNFC